MIPHALEEARETFRVAAVQKLHGDEPNVTRFQQAHSATIYNLDCVSEKIEVLSLIGQEEGYSHWQHFFYTMMNTDEFFRHFYSTRENLIQEINFSFGPQTDWEDQDPGLESSVTEYLKSVHGGQQPDWWSTIDVKNSDWWSQANRHRRHFVHHAGPKFKTVRTGGVFGDEPSSSDDYIALLDHAGGSSNLPVLRDLKDLRGELHKYCLQCYRVLESNV